MGVEGTSLPECELAHVRAIYGPVWGLGFRGLGIYIYIYIYIYM